MEMIERRYLPSLNLLQRQGLFLLSSFALYWIPLLWRYRAQMKQKEVNRMTSGLLLAEPPQ